MINQSIPLGALKQLKELRVDSKMCKHKHFIAADRQQKYHRGLGVSVIIVNIFIGTILYQYLKLQPPPEWVTPIGPIMAFLAASLSSLQTFFSFSKSAEGHRSIANRYNEISRQCKNLISRSEDDKSESKDLWEEVIRLTEGYLKINREAAAFPTTTKDYKKAEKENNNQNNIQTNKDKEIEKAKGVGSGSA